MSHIDQIVRFAGSPIVERLARNQLRRGLATGGAHFKENMKHA
jgi:hypothetical protein